MTTDPTITIAGLETRIGVLSEALHDANRGRADTATAASKLDARLAATESERDALAAQLAEARAALDATPKVCAIHSYEHGPGPCLTCGAWPPGTRELIAACKERIAGLEQAAGERAKEVARLTARVAELEARPVLTAPEQDDPMRHHESRDYALQSPTNGYWPASVGAVNGTEAMVMGAMLRSVGPLPINDTALLAMTRAAIACVESLGAAPTSPGTVAAVTVEELVRVYLDDKCSERDHRSNCEHCCIASGLRAVLARLEVSLVAPVDPEQMARDFAAGVPVRATLIARGIPVTPEVGK